jgi:uncharacterized protein
VSKYPVTERNRIRRSPKRAQYEREGIYEILDEGLLCHVGFIQDNQPFVIPTLYARLDDVVILHGAKGSRLMKHLQAGNPVCVTVTLVDGLVLARSVFHHSMNYRSVVLFGTGQIVGANDDKLRALEALTDHIVRGRWQDARKPNRQEMDATTVVSITIDTASAKIRTGPPSDAEEDYTLPVWAGVLPIPSQAQPPIPDPRLNADIPVPDYVTNYDRSRGA